MLISLVWVYLLIEFVCCGCILLAIYGLLLVVWWFVLLLFATWFIRWGFDFVLVVFVYGLVWTPLVGCLLRVCLLNGLLFNCCVLGW